MGIIGVFPLLAVPAIIYALFAFAVGNEGMASGLAAQAFAMPMASGVVWKLSWGGLLVTFSVLCLFVEILKSTKPSNAAMLDNALSVGAFIVCLILFILVPGFATTEFFIIMLMTLLDFLAGMVVMVSTAQRTVAYDPRHGGV
jgi:hypothetical protein